MIAKFIAPSDILIEFPDWFLFFTTIAILHVSSGDQTFSKLSYLVTSTVASRQIRRPGTSKMTVLPSCKRPASFASAARSGASSLIAS